MMGFVEPCAIFFVLVFWGSIFNLQCPSCYGRGTCEVVAKVVQGVVNGTANGTANTAVNTTIEAFVNATGRA